MLNMNIKVLQYIISVMMYVRTNIFLFLLSIFLFIDDEEACDCGHMICHMI